MSLLAPCPICLTPVAAAATCCPTCCLHRRAGTRPRGGAAAIALLGLSLAACDDKGDDSGQPLPQAEYGVAFVDEDLDGWAADGGDCDDSDAAIHPKATETPGDGVDSNCDGSDDT